MTKTQANEPGFVLVPREPTEAMLDAGDEAYLDAPEGESGFLALYRAMVDAAPSTPSPQIGKAGAGPVGEADEGWQPIETAPTGGKFGCFLMLAFGPPGDQTVSEGMHFQGRFYAASVFYTGGPHDTKQFTFREHEVEPTHWHHTLAAPGAARPVEEPGGVERHPVASAMPPRERMREKILADELAETRERLEKVETALRETLGFARALEKHSGKGTAGRRGGAIFTRAGTALTGDAQEAGR